MADDTSSRPKSRLWLPIFLLLAISAVAMGFGLVWVNVERNNLAYSLRLGYKERDTMMDANAKLANEVGALVAPHALARRAEEFGMHNAQPSQVWRLGDDGGVKK